MFDSGSASVKPYMHDILKEIGVALLDVENKISLDGHTDRSTYGNASRGYSNWELSADRANATRRELAASGMPEGKLARVVGMGSSVPLDPKDPLNPINRRISILVMTKEAEDRLLGTKNFPLDEPENESNAPMEAVAKSPP
jgi:chemotaxis protein MotB